MTRRSLRWKPRSDRSSRARRAWHEPLEPRMVLDSTVVFNELMYHPATDDPMLEWVELYNQQAVDMDISRWRIRGGIDYTFGPNTVLRGGAHLVIAASPSALQSATGFAGALGPYAGRLDNGGERLELVNNSGRVMDVLDYGDDGDWAVAPDGSGVTLAKRDPNGGSAEPANWTASRQIGGTPGARNFPLSVPTVVETTKIALTDAWRYNESGSDLGTAWRETTYDDSAWPSGNGLFYVTTATLPAAKNTLLNLNADGVPPNTTTFYFRTTFEFDGDLSSAGLKIRPVIDDGAVFYLNGQEVYRFNMLAGTVTYTTTAFPGVGNAVLSGPFSIPAMHLRRGTNTFAVEVHQNTTSSTDVAFGTELILTETIAPPSESGPPVGLNEVAGAGDAAFTIELANHGSTPIDVGGYVVTRSGMTDVDYVLPPQSLTAGQFLTLGETTLGFDAAEGDKIFLYTPGKARVLDAIVVKSAARGRVPAGTGAWHYVDAVTPNAANVVTLHRQIVINEIMYHHRPTPQQSAEYEESPVFAVDTTWKYDDAGVDRGIAWRSLGYDDSGWASGAGLLYNESSPLPAPKNTPLASGRGTYYFRKRFTYAGEPAGVQLSLNPIIDDGAVFYLNGVEIYRFNMPAGDIEFNTSATTLIDNAAFTGPVIVPATALVQGENLLAVEVHQATAPTGGGPAIQPQPGFSIAWDGSNGAFFSPSNPALAPDNAALASRGVTAFGSSQYGAGIHLIANINDGRYGNSNSWLANFPAGDSNPYIGLRFPQPQSIDSIAWGRDNGNTVSDACGGTCTDRSVGTYTIQVTRVASPGTGTTETGDAATGWQTIGTLTYGGGGGGFTPHLRHRYTLSQNGNPIQATGLRIKVSDDDIAIDEIEINAAVDSGNEDVVFGVSLATVVQTRPATEFAESDEEWIELYNNGSQPVNLTGWRLDEGIDFNFPAGTIIPAGGYLVVANNAAAVKAAFPAVAALILGDFDNNLGNGGDRIVLKDSRNNVADEVRYYDGGRWPSYADGGGSSLELIDPNADNSRPESWAASDESGKSSWHTYTYRGVAAAEFPPARWNEFVMGLFGDGEVLLDDISVIEFSSGAATQKLINGTFQSDTVGLPPASWRINGNERTSRVELDPDDPTNKVLRLISTGQTSDRFNHAETTFVGNAPAVNGREYEISFRAKWLAGTDQINTRLYFNRLARRTTLEAPNLNGTPGAVNSRRVTNAGPTYADLRHGPVVPNPNEQVTVSVAAHDPDGVASLVVKYSVNGGAFNTVVMTSQEGGRYAAVIPGQAASAIVQFYVEGSDLLGVATTFPAKGAASRALYKVQDGQAQPAGKHSLRIIMTAADTAFMHDAANVMSNEEYPATVVYDESVAFYNVGVTLHGSMAARADSNFMGFDLRFDPAEKFRGVHENVTIDRSGRGSVVGNGQDEMLTKHMLQAAGGIPSMYDDLVYVIAPRSSENKSALLLMAEYGDVFLDSQYEDGGDGTQFSYDLIYYQNNTTTGAFDAPKIPNGYGHPSYNVDLESLGDDKEKYRWHYRIQNNRAADDYSRLIEFLQAMSLVGSQTGGPLDLATQELMDVDQWMRLFAAQSAGGSGPDLYGRGLPHNLRLYVRPEDHKVLAFPWDWDLSVMGIPATADIYPSGAIRKVIDIPANKRLFLGHLQDLVSTVFNRAYMTYWTTHYSSLLPGQNFSSALTYLDNRGAFINSQLPPQVPFTATTGDVTTRTTLLSAGADATALVPSLGNGDQLGTTWTLVGFNDASWISGQTGAGYENSPGDPVNYTSLLRLDTAGMFNTNTSVFVRVPFSVATNPADFDRLMLRMKYDDGFVAYLNGVKVAEANAPGTLAWNSEATTNHDDTAATQFQEFDISAFRHLLVVGENVLAIHGLNRGIASSDLLVLPELEAQEVQSGADVVTVNQPFVTLGGRGWINVREIRLAGSNDPLPVSWPTIDTWQVTVPVQFGPNHLVFQAYDFRGNLIGTDEMTVHSTFSDRPLEDFLRITELNYHPADPTPTEIAAGITDSERFEFVELVNLSPNRTLNLTGVRFVDGIEFDFTGSAVTMLGPGEYVLIVGDAAAFGVRYGTTGFRIAGQYTGRLNNAGERLVLRDGNNTVLHDFTYDDDPLTWYPTTDGDGPTLVIRDPAGDKALWNVPVGWKASSLNGGTPGRGESLGGDVNEDGRVGLVDLAIVQAHLDLATGATPGDGDLTGDGAVSRDDVLALLGSYGQGVVGSPAASPAAAAVDAVAAAMGGADPRFDAAAMAHPPSASGSPEREDVSARRTLLRALARRLIAVRPTVDVVEPPVSPAVGKRTTGSRRILEVCPSCLR